MFTRNIIETLNNLVNSTTTNPTNREIAKAILETLKTSKVLSITKIAIQANCTKSTVTKFAKFLNF